MIKEIVHTKDILPFLKQELGKVSQQLIVVSAFVKIEALKELDSYLTTPIEKILLVRFRKSDILANSTDLDLYEYCKNNGWKMYFNFDLHSKIYVFDKETFFIGSANATLSGLGIHENANIESGVVGFCKLNEYTKILEVFENAILMEDFLMTEFKNQTSNQINKDVFQEWFLHDLNIVKRPFRNLWICDFIVSPNTFDIRSQDLKLLDLTREESYDTKILATRFKQLKCFQWLLTAIENEIYFGELTAKLHNTLIDDPIPLRKDVKVILSTLLTWIMELNIDDFIIDRPNYSQRIRKNINTF